MPWRATRPLLRSGPTRADPSVVVGGKRRRRLDARGTRAHSDRLPKPSLNRKPEPWPLCGEAASSMHQSGRATPGRPALRAPAGRRHRISSSAGAPAFGSGGPQGIAEPGRGGRGRVSVPASAEEGIPSPGRSGSGFPQGVAAGALSQELRAVCIALYPRTAIACEDKMRCAGRHRPPPISPRANAKWTCMRRHVEAPASKHIYLVRCPACRYVGACRHSWATKPDGTTGMCCPSYPVTMQYWHRRVADDYVRRILPSIELFTKTVPGCKYKIKDIRKDVKGCYHEKELHVHVIK